MLEEYISQSEAQAWLVSSKYYDALAKNERENISKLEEEKNALISEFNTAMNSGKIDKYSEAWYEMVNAIDDVTLAITEGETALLEYAQTIQQLKWEQFDILQDRISSITEETEFLIELMSSDKLFEDNGKLTDSGKATMGQHGVAYNTYMYQSDLAGAEAERLKKELATDGYDIELEERYREMIALQQEYILNAQQEKEAIRDLVSEGIELELDALSELIDKYNEALNSEKDLYSYQRDIEKQTSNIGNLRKQLASLEGDDSESAKAKIQELRVSLKEAEADLEETEFDRYLQNTEKILDDLYLDYETVLNERLDGLDALVSDMIAEINADAGIISDTITEKADSVGYTLTTEMQTIWSGANNVITTYGEKFSQAQTTTNSALNQINTNLQNMINQLNAKANANVKTASTSSASNPPKSSSSNKPSSTPSTKPSGGDGKPKVGDKVKFVSGQYYYSSDGFNPVGSKHLGQQVYITKIEDESWATHPYHISTGNKLGSGDLGWLKLSQISGYATGKKNFSHDELAWTQENGLEEYIVRPSDGAILTPIARKGSVLNAQASNNLWNMTNSPAEFIKDNLNLGNTNIPNNSNVQSNLTQNFENITFSLPNVHGYSELLTEMQRDPKFEKLILAMTVDRIAGKSSLAKGKAIR